MRVLSLPLSRTATAKRRSLRVFCAGALQWIAGAAERQRQRRQLASLDGAALRDLGLSREAVDAEARKPFWR